MFHVFNHIHNYKCDKRRSNYSLRPELMYVFYSRHDRMNKNKNYRYKFKVVYNNNFQLNAIKICYMDV